MNYDEMKNKVFAGGIVADGYSGNAKSVEFAYDHKSGKTIMIHDMGCHLTALPPAIDEHESNWLLQNHPSSPIVRGFWTTEYTDHD